MCSGETIDVGDDAYSFALQERVFPVLHLGVEFCPQEFESDNGAKGIEEDWDLSPWTMNAIHRKLLAAERDENSTFYKFERSLVSSPYTTSMPRDDLLAAFKYFFKSGVPPAMFWQRFCRRGEAPMEALYVISGGTYDIFESNLNKSQMH